MVRVRDVLAAWGQVTVVRPLGGGNRNDLLEIHRGRERLVARRSRRTPASLDWEVDLLDHLVGHGLRVPAILPSLDGRRHVEGVVVQAWLDGAAPADRDWPAVAETLRRLHAVTANWPQRPGFASTRELLDMDRGGDVDLTVMPAAAVAACRNAWRPLAGRPEAVVHGDPGASNIRVADGEVGLLDWDEARVDCTDLDLAELPAAGVPAGLPPGPLAAARRAATAWEAANGWIVEPAYARRQLELLQAGRDSFG
jgi:Ser/Thr protein kinase RdoA (MazF antagonist)